MQEDESESAGETEQEGRQGEAARDETRCAGDRDFLEMEPTLELRGGSKEGVGRSGG